MDYALKDLDNEQDEALEPDNDWLEVLEAYHKAVSDPEFLRELDEACY